MTKTEKLEVALVLKRRCEEDRHAAATLPAGSNEHAQKICCQLYNAATAFALWQDSNASGDFDQMVAFTTNLEEAAMAYALK